MPHPVYLQCAGANTGCGSRFRIERLEPNTVIGIPRFCPNCGHNEVQAGIDLDQDHWYTLASSFGFEPSEAGANLIRQMFNLWDGRQYRSFRKFIEAELASVNRH